MRLLGLDWFIKLANKHEEQDDVSVHCLIVTCSLYEKQIIDINELEERLGVSPKLLSTKEYYNLCARFFKYLDKPEKALCYGIKLRIAKNLLNKEYPIWDAYLRKRLCLTLLGKRKDFYQLNYNELITLNKRLELWGV